MALENRGSSPFGPDRAAATFCVKPELIETRRLLPAPPQFKIKHEHTTTPFLLQT